MISVYDNACVKIKSQTTREVVCNFYCVGGICSKKLLQCNESAQVGCEQTHRNGQKNDAEELA